eukprot:353588-Chlamydomonas_euryale.AAC.8
MCSKGLQGTHVSTSTYVALERMRNVASGCGYVHLPQCVAHVGSKHVPETLTAGACTNEIMQSCHGGDGGGGADGGEHVRWSCAHSVRVAHKVLLLRRDGRTQAKDSGVF